MDAKNEGRCDADLLIIEALAAGYRYGAAAQAAVSPSTVKRRMRDPEFRCRVTQARLANARSLRDSVLEASVGAVRKLVELAEQGSTEAIQLGAARTLLAHAPLAPSHRITERDVLLMIGAVLTAAEDHLSEDAYMDLLQESAIRLHPQISAIFLSP
jgi:hypothetical protein